MSMADHDFDFELIMALAEGALSPTEAEAAEARLDDAAREELAIQRMAIAAMADMPEPAMSASERSSVRDAVRSELNLEPAPARPVPGATNARPWYVRFMPALGAAAALVIVVGIGVSGGLGGGDDADTDDGSVAADAPVNQSELSGSFGGADTAEDATATAESAEAPSAESLAAASGESARDATSDDFAEEAADETATDGDDAADGTTAETTAATEAVADEPAADPGFRLVYIGDGITSTPGEVDEVMAGHIERTTSTPLPIVDAPAFFEDQLLLQCWEEATSRADEEGTALASVVIAGNGKLDGQDAEFYEFDRDPSGIIVVVAADTCEELLTITR